MKSLLYSLLLLASARYARAASDKPLKPCTIVSPTTERFFDLNPIRRMPLEDGQKKPKGDSDGSWHARGYDYGANFTLNICGPVVEELHDVQDLDKDLWQNVSAFYEVGKKVYSIGYVLHHRGAWQCSSIQRISN
jgi:cation-dependent mannose-6-phosphate receptor